MKSDPCPRRVARRAIAAALALLWVLPASARAVERATMKELNTSWTSVTERVLEATGQVNELGRPVDGNADRFRQVVGVFDRSLKGRARNGMIGSNPDHTVTASLFERFRGPSESVVAESRPKGVHHGDHSLSYVQWPRVTAVSLVDFPNGWTLGLSRLTAADGASSEDLLEGLTSLETSSRQDRKVTYRRVDDGDRGNTIVRVSNHLTAATGERVEHAGRSIAVGAVPPLQLPAKLAGKEVPKTILDATNDLLAQVQQAVVSRVKDRAIEARRLTGQNQQLDPETKKLVLEVGEKFGAPHLVVLTAAFLEHALRTGASQSTDAGDSVLRAKPFAASRDVRFESLHIRPPRQGQDGHLFLRGHYGPARHGLTIGLSVTRDKHLSAELFHEVRR